MLKDGPEAVVQIMATIVTFGDSVTYGVHKGVTESETYSAVTETQLREQGIAVAVVRQGVSGENTTGGLQRLPEVLALRPQYLTIMYGLNDAYLAGEQENTWEVSPEQYAHNLTVMITRCRDAGIIPVLLTPNPMSPWGSSTESFGHRPPYSTVGDINFMLQRYVKAVIQVGQDEEAPVIDIYDFLLTHGVHEDAMNRYLIDGVHPTSTGHRLIALRVTEFFLQQLRGH